MIFSTAAIGLKLNGTSAVGGASWLALTCVRHARSTSHARKRRYLARVQLGIKKAATTIEPTMSEMMQYSTALTRGSRKAVEGRGASQARKESGCRRAQSEGIALARAGDFGARRSCISCGRFTLALTVHAAQDDDESGHDEENRLQLVLEWELVGHHPLLKHRRDKEEKHLPAPRAQERHAIQ